MGNEATPLEESGTGDPARSDVRDGSPERRTDGDVALSVTNLTKTFGSGDDAVRAVDGVDFEVERGTVVGLLGPNGAGKTTTIKSVLGLVLPDSGAAFVDGVDVTDSPRAAYGNVAAMLEGARNVYWRLTVRENMRFFARLGGKPADMGRIDELIDTVGLAEKADVPVNELSRGMKGKASLACTLVRETPITFLDEPTLGLDVESSRELRRQLRRMVEVESRTVLLSSHDMDVVEAVCDRVIVMTDGRIVADDTVENLKDVFRTGAYRVVVDGAFAPNVRTRLEDRFDAENWSREGTRRRFDVRHVRGAEFHALMDLVREADPVLVRVDTVEPDLEEVFLDVVDERHREGEP